ncbi:MAG: DUF4214 domain-containing protein [Halieaceae bacterium]|nr:DUF4214 domain-containing protein [Halieaceae bacterium]
MRIFKLLNTLGLALLMSLCLGSVAQTGDEDEPNYRDQVQIMYLAYYGRPGDAGGLDFWAGKLEGVNGKLEEIINEFGTSKEFTDRFGDLDDEELVNNIYRQLLGRDADSEGLNFYVNGLREGRFTLASLALDIVKGTQQNPGGRDAATLANKLQAANAFSEAHVEADAPYGEFQIDDAKLWLGEVDSTSASVTAAMDRLPDLLEMFAGRTVRRPDLEVGSPSAGTTSLTTGSSFTLSATVSNTGDGDSLATTLRYYRSADAAISASDTQVGTDAVAALAASGSSAELVALTAPSAVGTYYYGACVDAVARESNTTNNCSASARVEVGEPEPQTSPGGDVGGGVGGTPPPSPPPPPKVDDPDPVLTGLSISVGRASGRKTSIRLALQPENAEPLPLFGDWEPFEAGSLCCYIGEFKVLQFWCDADYTGSVQIIITAERFNGSFEDSASFICE